MYSGGHGYDRKRIEVEQEKLSGTCDRIMAQDRRITVSISDKEKFIGAVTAHLTKADVERLVAEGLIVEQNGRLEFTQEAVQGLLKLLEDTTQIIAAFTGGANEQQEV